MIELDPPINLQDYDFDYEIMQAEEFKRKEAEFYDNDYKFYISSPFPKINYTHDNYINYLEYNYDENVF